MTTVVSPEEAPTGDYRFLIQEDRVHGSLYTDPAVFAEEMKRIFVDGWVFVGHESEIPDPGDWVARRVGLEPVLLTRGRDGALNVIANRCAHRGTRLCPQNEGNDRTLRCPYHGWTYGIDGALLGVTGPKGFHKNKADLGLDRPASVDVYQGFVFANISGTAGPLGEHLGRGGISLIDRAVQMSPTGRVDLRGGWIGQRVDSNWKMWPESNNDGYHVGFTHESLARAVPGSQYDDIVLGGEGKTSSTTRDHGLGHVELDFRSSYESQLAWLGTSREKVAEYCEAMEAAYGEERANQILWDGPPHANIFPNLFLGEMNIARIDPISPDRTEHFHTPLLLEGVPDSLNRRLLLQSEAAMGPCAFFLPDDVAVAERMHAAFNAGLQADQGWIDLSRGNQRERVEDGVKVGDITDEVTNRGIWHHYREVMANGVGRA
ncbi:MAG: Rieske 2Fe-2S domain-containing protein [Acidimicrobiia bacterium]|nr:Rieske 2Fe-2S domain-containing protein [Acidimicrobiia bacterium]